MKIVICPYCKKAGVPLGSNWVDWKSVLVPLEARDGIEKFICPDCHKLCEKSDLLFLSTEIKTKKELGIEDTEEMMFS